MTIARRPSRPRRPGRRLSHRLGRRLGHRLSHRLGRRLGLLVVELAVPAAILTGFGVWSARAENFFFPPLTEIARVFVDTWLFDRVGSDLLPSLARLLSGYGLAVVSGVAVGLLLGLSRTAGTAADPVIQFLRSLPAPALIPFSLLVFGTGDSAKVFIIALGALWPVLLNTIDGVRGVDPLHLDTARAYRLPAAVRLRRVILPAASPRIFAGMRTSLAIAIVLMVVSEMVASRNGVGYLVLRSQRSFAIPQMWSGIVLLGLLGYTLNWIYLRIEAHYLAWYRGAQDLLGETAPLRSRRATGAPGGWRTNPWRNRWSSPSAPAAPAAGPAADPPGE
jgi:ABC-type nitrate/sulfonate/bicarbonate transport system permease component